MSEKLSPYRPAHFRATWSASAGKPIAYACFAHEHRLREDAADRATVFALTPDERDSAGIWCGYCSPQGDITHTKESDQ